MLPLPFSAEVALAHPLQRLATNAGTYALQTLGLPAIAMGLLALFLPPADAASILIVPTVATNIWQMAAGPSLKPVLVRLAPMMLGVVAGTLAGAGWLVHDRLGAALLGGALMLYALTSLASLHVRVARPTEVWLGPLVGLTTGLVAAATGVFAMPAVIYLQAIGLDKEDLVQALGLSCSGFWRSGFIWSCELWREGCGTCFASFTVMITPACTAASNIVAPPGRNGSLTADGGAELVREQPLPGDAFSPLFALR